MFKKRTLFVIGAGASAEVDLPVGTALAQNISNMLNVQTGDPANTPGNILLGQLYERFPLSTNGYHKAAVAIRDGVRFANSIDDYLDRHRENEL